MLFRCIAATSSLRHQRLLPFPRGLASPLQARLRQLCVCRTSCLSPTTPSGVLNAAACLVFRLRRYDHVTDAVAILHWLRLPERVNFKLARMAYRVLNGMAPSYLNLLVPVSNLPGHRRLRSSFTQQLLVPPYCLSTVGRRSFSVAALHLLEHSTQRHSICTISFFLSPAAKDIPVSSILP